MRYHFCNSPDPLKEGTTIKAICGEEIPHAALKAAADTYEVNCKQCIWAWTGTVFKPNEPRYLAVAAAGQEARDGQ